MITIMLDILQLNKSKKKFQAVKKAHQMIVTRKMLKNQLLF